MCQIQKHFIDPLPIDHLEKSPPFVYFGYKILMTKYKYPYVFDSRTNMIQGKSQPNKMEVQNLHSGVISPHL